MPVFAKLVRCSEHHVRAAFKDFNERGLKALEATCRCGRPPEFAEDYKSFIVETGKCPPDRPGCLFNFLPLGKDCVSLEQERNPFSKPSGTQNLFK